MSHAGVDGALRIRDASLRDAEAIGLMEGAIFGREAWSLDLVRDELTADYRRYVVVVDASESVRGYAGLLVVGDDADIQTIALSPEVRGSGLGRTLMTVLLDEAVKRGASQVFLEVRADNPVARGLYAALGFDEIAVRPRYYQPDDIDAIVMKKELR